VSVNTKTNITPGGTPFALVARRMWNIGFLPIPCRRKDKPSLAWKSVTRSSDIYEKSNFAIFDDHRHGYIAVIAGAPSGNVECIDFDLKYDLTGTLFNRFESLLFDNDPFLFRKMVILSTPSGGKHLIYRCDTVGRNQKLAQRSVTNEEALKAVELNPFVAEGATEEEREEIMQKALNQSRVLIETRANGGYFLTFPSPGYTFDNEDKTFASIEVISDKEREMLLAVCRSFNEFESGKVSESDSISLRNSIVIEQGNGGTGVSARTAGKYEIMPWDDYIERGLDHAIDVLISEGWSIVSTHFHPSDGRQILHLKRPGNSSQEHSATYNEVPGKFWVWSTSTVFPSERPLNNFDIYCTIRAGGDRKRAATMLFGEGFGKLKEKNLPPSKAPLATIERVNSAIDVMRRETVAGEYGMPGMGINDAQMIGMPVMGQFVSEWWTTSVDQKRDGSYLVKKSIVLSKFIDFLKDKGFRRYLNFGKYGFVRVVGYHVEHVDRSHITEVIMAYCNKLPKRFDYMERDDLKELYMKSIDKALGQNVLEALPLFDDEMTMRDTKTHAYIVLRNGVLVSHSTTSWFSTDLSSIGKYIWKDKVIDRSINSSCTEAEMDSHPFSVFMYNIAGRDPQRYLNLLALVGYSIHNYKDPSIPAAVILCDSKMGDTSEGGTGKGLLVKAMSYVRNLVTEDGKAFSVKNKTEFRFGRVNKNTDVFHIADLTKNFNFESLFSIITEGFPIRHLYKNEEYIPYANSPKVVISTNFTVLGDGASHDRRRIEFELAPHYNQRYSPYHEFKHRFFDEWDRDQWSTFYHIMARCQRLYIQNGLPSFKPIALEEKKFMNATTPDFAQFIFGVLGTKEEVSRSGIKNSTNGRFEVEFNLFYNQYLSYASIDKYETRSTRFRNMLTRACVYLGLNYSENIKKASPQYLSDSYTKYIDITDPDFHMRSGSDVDHPSAVEFSSPVQSKMSFDGQEDT
jgi:hypothetical protein